MNIFQYYSIPVRKNSIRNTLFFSVASRKFKQNLSKNEYICFELFEVWVLNFLLKEETMRTIPNRNVAELTHYIIVF